MCFPSSLSASLLALAAELFSAAPIIQWHYKPEPDFGAWRIALPASVIRRGRQINRMTFIRDFPSWSNRTIGNDTRLKSTVNSLRKGADDLKFCIFIRAHSDLCAPTHGL